MFSMIDSHMHLAMVQEKGIDISSLMEKLRSAGFVGGLDIGIHAHDLAKRRALLSPYPEIRLAAGLFPGDAESDDIDALLLALEENIQQYSPHAVGEMGLDFHWNYATEERQRYLFSKQIALANRYNLPIIVHNRNADEQTLDVLRSHRPLHGCIMHCYSSPPEYVELFSDLDCYISLAGNVTFKNSVGLREAARLISPERMLIETDSPFLSPEPRRGKINTPAHIGYIYECVATQRNTSVSELAEQVCENFFRLFPNEGARPRD
ncbi:MAG: TatD family hydrolase [Spirochaetota bacterium]